LVSVSQHSTLTMLVRFSLPAVMATEAAPTV
jgi:hypothetical protein